MRSRAKRKAVAALPPGLAGMAKVFEARLARTTVKDPKCFRCQKPVTEDEHCSGCGAYVCDGCDVSFCLMGSHDKNEHLVDHEETDR